MFGVYVDAFETMGDDNEGLEFGVEYYDEDPREDEDAEVVDVEWFGSEKARDKGMKLIDITIV